MKRSVLNKKMRGLLSVVIGLSLVWMVGCGGSEEETTDDSATMDTDTDADTDTDSDTDSDSDTPVALTWVSIPGGTFQMGSTTGSWEEQPVHSVTVPSFEMLKTEVTVTQYGECVNDGVCSMPGSGGEHDNWGVTGRGNHPVNSVDWNQAVSFCGWAGGRLPSEAEWEYAASNGASETEYPWGEAKATCEFAVMYDGKEYGCGTGFTWNVCSKTAGNTSHGLCDMSGNVWEWVQDGWHRDYTGAPTDGSVWEKSYSAYRVVRGGSFFFDGYGDFLRAANRSHDLGPSYQIDWVLGVRCVR